VRHLLLSLGTLVVIASSAAADTTPQTLPFTQDWTNTGLITANDNWSAVPGVEGHLGQDITIATNGADPQLLVTDSTLANDVDVIANGLSPGTSTAGGVGEFHITNPTVALQGSGTADAPHIILTLNTTGAFGVRVTYNVRDIDDNATDNAIQQVALQYRVGTTGMWTNVPEAYVADATTIATATQVTAISVLLPSVLDNQAVVQLRMITSNAQGADEWVGIDDIQVFDDPTGPTAVGMSSPASGPRGSNVSLTAAVTLGTAPASTGVTVVCDLTSIGGSATQALVDDGTNGDGLAGDNIFTFATTVAVSSAPGAKTFACTVRDAEARSSTFNIGFSVTANCGDGVIEGAETCDDNGTTPGDGCSATCTVETGYTCTGAPSICSDIDECTLDTDNCDANATCANTTGSFTCACNSGYTGTGVTCADVDECTANTDNCDANAMCTNTPGSFTCACNAGFSGNGVTCADIDECTANTDDCAALAVCANTAGSFTCACPSGYSGTGHGATGCADVDECAANTDTCDANATCTNTAGAFTCACKTGFTGNGMTCTDINECTAGTDNCDVNATCTNMPGSFTCACAAGYSGNGATCTPNCGDGMMIAPEACDDGDMTSGDGCSMNCTVETGYACTGAPSMCAAVCGDGLKVAGEACDDSNTDDGDGCDANCAIEDGFTCLGTPSICEPPDDGGCCSSSTNPGGVALLAMFVLFGLRRRKRG
jgi:MYXO-CTERM domain-containing protein